MQVPTTQLPNDQLDPSSGVQSGVNGQSQANSQTQGLLDDVDSSPPGRQSLQQIVEPSEPVFIPAQEDDLGQSDQTQANHTAQTDMYSVGVVSAGVIGSVKLQSITQGEGGMTSYPDKERASATSLEQNGLVGLAEAAPFSPELEPEVEGFMEKVVEAETPILQDDLRHEGALVAQPQHHQVQEHVVLPMTQASVQNGLTRKVSDSARWLAVWCLRVIKLLGDQVQYKS